MYLSICVYIEGDNLALKSWKAYSKVDDGYVVACYMLLENGEVLSLF